MNYEFYFIGIAVVIIISWLLMMNKRDINREDFLKRRNEKTKNLVEFTEEEMD